MIFTFPKTERSLAITKRNCNGKNQKQCHLGMPLIFYDLQLRGHRRNLSNVQQWPPHHQNVTSSPWLNGKTWPCRDEGAYDQVIEYVKTCCYWCHFPLKFRHELQYHRITSRLESVSKISRIISTSSNINAVGIRMYILYIILYMYTLGVVPLHTYN